MCPEGVREVPLLYEDHGDVRMHRGGEGRPAAGRDVRLVPQVQGEARGGVQEPCREQLHLLRGSHRRQLPAGSHRPGCSSLPFWNHRLLYAEGAAMREV